MKPVAIYVVLDDAEYPRYVGKTLNPRKRLTEHARRFQWVAAIRVLEWVAPNERWQNRERYWIAYYRRFARLENIARGGGNAGIKSEETKRRFREKMVGRKIPREHVQKMMATRAARTEEERRAIGQRISEAKKGKAPNWSAEGKARTIAALKKRGSPMQGKKHSPATIALLRIKNKRPPNSGSFQVGRSFPKSEEWKAKVRLAMTGRKVSEETKAKLRAANLGKRHSDETRAKMRISQRARLNECEGLFN